MKAVVTRERGSNDSLVEWLPDDATVKEVPLTTTRYFNADEVLTTLRASEFFGAYRALVVTSARTALYVSLARTALGEGATVVSVGSATARALESDDVEVDVVGDAGAEDLASQISEGPVLLLGAASMRPELATALQSRGLSVTTLTCYETVPVVLSDNEVNELREGDVVFIGAPSAWLVAKAFVANDAWVVVPGATTGTVVRRDHARVIEGWGVSLREHLRAL
jgi:uroporphyrinogen-III synthase